jgi:hypothetical protein
MGNAGGLQRMVVGLPPWAPQGRSGQDEVTMFPDDFFDFLYFLLLGEGSGRRRMHSKGSGYAEG